MLNKYLIPFFFILLVSCNDSTSSKLPSINGDTILKHLEELSADKYLGRMPCGPTDQMTVDYISDALKELGIKPGNNGSYFQEVPLLTIDGDISETMAIKYPDKQEIWKKGKDFVIHSERKVDNIGFKDSELVFCGYGIVDEKLGWNDYEGIDMKGKTAVVLVNDPGYGGEDQQFFKGDIMTYYGRWTYKYDEADRQGADGLIIIHEKNSAGYPWFVVQSSWTGPQQGLSGIDRSNDCGVKGWITLDNAVKLFENAGYDFTTEIKKARTKDFKPFSLKGKATASLDNHYSECISNNVIGFIEGSKYPEEYIVYTAHWDHIGIGKVVAGDSIYNGALDNASGVAAVLSIAESFAKANTRPERSVVFLFVTAEEQGLLGSEYYAENPIFPLAKTVCNLNIDGVNPAGPMKDFTIVGKGHSEMDQFAEKAAIAQGRYILDEQEPEKGYFFRSDHFNFAKKGVPALYGDGGYDHVEKGKEYAKAFKDDFIANNYHAPSDEFDPEKWDVNGMIQDAQIYFNIGYNISNSRDWPKWYEDSEFSRKKPTVKD
ncbi:MAG: M20/M25/M40 family metallo-hydrolase [Saprospiraceae bacterium]|nr:M20/M25/M40 family metallo-hydrolase [Saprospiraceae bacterium]